MLHEYEVHQSCFRACKCTWPVALRLKAVAAAVAAVTNAHENAEATNHPQHFPIMQCSSQTNINLVSQG